MKIEGNLIKMETELENPVKYYLNLNKEKILMNELIGKQLHILFKNQINCIHCGVRIKTSYQQGYCYNCYNTLPQTDISVMQPEKNKAHLGISRDMQWSEKNDLQPHCVYLALTNNLKVGVTRSTQVPTRWIDQGAWKVIRLSKTPNRHIAGIIEKFLKQYLKDKTSWKDMLTDTRENNIDIKTEKEKVTLLLPEELQQYKDKDNTVLEIKYPIDKYPNTVKNINFEKLSDINKKLIGIRGQYFIFDDNLVFNVRRHNGYLVSLQNL